MPVLAILANRYAERGLQIHMPPNLSLAQLQTTLPVEILETVFVSLWDNSLQHGANESNVHFLPNEPKAFCFEMSDNGPGISEGNSQQIFTPFFTTNRDFGGTGLGLSITRQLLETYGASIEFTGNHPGATFRLTLPATDSGNKGLNL
jgi:K+-sensing histidine kinase KdpD